MRVTTCLLYDRIIILTIQYDVFRRWPSANTANKASKLANGGGKTYASLTTGQFQGFPYH